MNATRAKLLLLGALVGAGLLSAAACGGGDTKPASSPAEPAASAAAAEKPAPAASDTPPASSSAAAPAAPTPAAAEPASTPLGQVLLTDSHQIQKLYDTASAAPAAKLADSGAAGANPLAKGLHEAAMKLPAGMKPEGPMATGALKEKQHLQTDITLQPGKCYSILGFSKKVKDLDLYLFVPPGILSGQDLTDDNRPVIGGPPQPLCPVSSTPITYKLDIVADSGAGDVVVQLYSKGN